MESFGIDTALQNANVLSDNMYKVATDMANSFLEKSVIKNFRMVSLHNLR